MAQTASADSGTARFSRLSVEHGLSQSSVQQIFQDRQGLMWFGTQEGLNRFDGYRFTIHRARERDGFLRDHDITALADDRDGDLWVGTSRGLYRHDLETGRFDTCASPVDGLHILEVVRGPAGTIFFTASDGHLWTVDAGHGECRPRPFAATGQPALTGVTAVASGGAALWISAGGRLLRIEDATASGGRVIDAGADVGTASVLAVDPEGHVWIGGGHSELGRHRPGAGGVDRFPQAPRGILTILAARDGRVWIGARRGGLTRLDPRNGTVTTFRHDVEDASSLLGNDVASLHEDANGSLWIGSWNAGVSRFDPHAQALRTIRARAGDPASIPNDVIAMSEAPDRRLWFVSRSGLVGLGDPRRSSFRTVATLEGRGRLTSITSWRTAVFVGTSTGLVALDAATGRVLPLDASLQSGGLGRSSIAALQVSADALWIATGRELHRLAGTQGRPSVTRFEIPIDGVVSVLAPTARHGLWIGSDRGEIIQLDGSSTPEVLRPPAIQDSESRASLAAHGFVTTVHEDHGGRLWIGTRRGLGRIELASGRVTWLGEDDGLPSTNIAAMAPGADGLVWIAHNRGLTRMDPASGAMTHFGAAEGAQGRGYADGAWTAGPSGLLYFAGDAVTFFDPREIRPSPVKPRVVLTGLEILHRVVAPRWLEPDSPLERAIDAQREITLDPGATVFSIEMAPIDYVDPSSNRLRYRLEGFDPDWIETPARNRIATYTNLAPGRYVLRARAGTRNGLWSDQEATLAITLLPPWWRTRSAIVLWIAIAAAGAAFGRVSMRRRTRVRQALQEREALRRDSLTDPLSGLHNRRFLNSWLDQEVPKIVREYRTRGPASGADLLLVLIDVDHFKSINDRHSHAVGDRVIARVALALKDAIRGSDLAVRWGGDEFLVVIRNLQRERAADYAERLRTAVEEAVSAAGDPTATASIGYAAFPFLPHDAAALSWEQTLELADHALRVTKGRQRNSHTGLHARPEASADDVRGFLGGAPRPSSIEVLG